MSREAELGGRCAELTRASELGWSWVMVTGGSVMVRMGLGDGQDRDE